MQYPVVSFAALGVHTYPQFRIFSLEEFPSQPELSSITGA